MDKKTIKRGKATVRVAGDVTTVRVVDYRGQRPQQQRDELTSGGERAPDVERLKHLDLVAFNTQAERLFVQMLVRLCDEMPDGVPILGARAEAAFSLNISTETAKRYIEKFCFAFSAPFTVRDGAIFKKGATR